MILHYCAVGAPCRDATVSVISWIVHVYMYAHIKLISYFNFVCYASNAINSCTCASDQCNVSTAGDFL